MMTKIDRVLLLARKSNLNNTRATASSCDASSTNLQLTDSDSARVNGHDSPYNASFDSKHMHLTVHARTKQLQLAA